MKTIIEMAREAGLIVDANQSGFDSVGAFAELVTEQANARANTSWALMCKKMVAIEREACAKVCEDLYKKWVDDLVNDTDNTADSGTPDCVDCAAAIRARGNT